LNMYGDSRNQITVLPLEARLEPRTSINKDYGWDTSKSWGEIRVESGGVGVLLHTVLMGGGYVEKEKVWSNIRIVGVFVFFE
jgi:hypothetical protein